MDQSIIFKVIEIDDSKLFNIRSIILSNCTDDEIRNNDIGWLILSKTVDLILKIENHFKIEISDEESEMIQTLDDLIEVIQTKLK